MNTRFIVIGKPTQEYAAVIREYEKRLTKYCRFEVFEEKNEKSILPKLTGAVVVLDRAGKQFSSEELADYLRWRDVTFVVGGAEGLTDEVKGRANLLLSFSRMTFPHQLARLILTEQVYRAFTILKNEKYHK